MVFVASMYTDWLAELSAEQQQKLRGKNKLIIASLKLLRDSHEQFLALELLEQGNLTPKMLHNGLVRGWSINGIEWAIGVQKFLTDYYCETRVDTVYWTVAHRLYGLFDDCRAEPAEESAARLKLIQRTIGEMQFFTPYMEEVARDIVAAGNNLHLQSLRAVEEHYADQLHEHKLRDRFFDLDFYDPDPRELQDTPCYESCYKVITPR